MSLIIKTEQDHLIIVIYHDTLLEFSTFSFVETRQSLSGDVLFSGHVNIPVYGVDTQAWMITWKHLGVEWGQSTEGQRRLLRPIKSSHPFLLHPL